MENTDIYRAIEEQIDSGVSPQMVLDVLRGNPLYVLNLSLTTPEEDRRFLEHSINYAKGKDVI